jgi:hypothetical protein
MDQQVVSSRDYWWQMFYGIAKRNYMGLVMKTEIQCDICNSTNQTRHFELYAFGSEGVWLCLKHQCDVNKFILDMQHAEMRIKRDVALERKRKGD